ncbi:MAG TPA: hypothetical protein VGE04_04185 [Chloroflexia bacterium]|jgi:tetrahydromethanopterin S-methyltransferase subunit G
MWLIRRNIEITGVVLSFVALGALLIALIANPSSDLNPFDSDLSRTAQRQQIASLRSDLIRMESDLAHLSEEVNALSRVPEDVSVAAQLGSLNSSLDNLHERFTRIESIIIADPAKALELPLIRKDIDSIREVNQSEAAAIRQDIERSYTLIIGTILTLALAVLATAFSNITKKGKEKDT